MNGNASAREILSNRNLKMTAFRLKLLDLFLKEKKAVSYSEIQKQLGEADRITLYRTLSTMLEKGIIHKALQDNNQTFYALCGNTCDSKKHSHDHVHFQCSNCQSVTCEHLDNEIFLSLKEFQIDQVDIRLTGLCKLCSR